MGGATAKTRAEVAAFINKQMDAETDPPAGKPNSWHYGVVDLRQLMDFVFDGIPASKEEEILPP
jgi:hypothetical protein